VLDKRSSMNLLQISESFY